MLYSVTFTSLFTVTHFSVMHLQQQQIHRQRTFSQFCLRSHVTRRGIVLICPCTAPVTCSVIAEGERISGRTGALVTGSRVGGRLGRLAGRWEIGPSDGSAGGRAVWRVSGRSGRQAGRQEVEPSGGSACFCLFCFRSVIYRNHPNCLTLYV